MNNEVLYTRDNVILIKGYDTYRVIIQLNKHSYIIKLANIAYILSFYYSIVSLYIFNTKRVF